MTRSGGPGTAGPPAGTPKVAASRCAGFTPAVGTPDGCPALGPTAVRTALIRQELPRPVLRRVQAPRWGLAILGGTAHAARHRKAYRAGSASEGSGPGGDPDVPPRAH